jgi:hypothetical protein
LEENHGGRDVIRGRHNFQFIRLVAHASSHARTIPFASHTAAMPGALPFWGENQ